MLLLLLLLFLLYYGMWREPPVLCGEVRLGGACTYVSAYGGGRVV